MTEAGSLQTRAVLYLRVSTGDQEVANQRPDLETYVRARGWRLVQEYSDVGVSGSKSRRPGLDTLMNDAAKGKFDAVLVWRFDRFARSTKHLTDALHEFRERGIRFISYQENIDLGTPMGEAMFTIIAAIAQLERDIIRERIKAGLRRAMLEGRRPGRKALPLEASKIQALRAQGMTVRGISVALGISKSRIGYFLKSQPADILLRDHDKAT